MIINRTITALFLIAGLINFAPVVGVISDELIATAYGIDVTHRELSLLLRHRALLFGIVGGLLLVAAFRPNLRPVASACGFISMVGFALLHMIIEPEAIELKKVLELDFVGLVALTGAVMLPKLQETQKED